MCFPAMRSIDWAVPIVRIWGEVNGSGRRVLVVRIGAGHSGVAMGCPHLPFQARHGASDRAVRTLNHKEHNSAMTAAAATDVNIRYPLPEELSHRVLTLGSGQSRQTQASSAHDSAPPISNPQPHLHLHAHAHSHHSVSSARLTASPLRWTRERRRRPDRQHGGNTATHSGPPETRSPLSGVSAGRGRHLIHPHIDRLVYVRKRRNLKSGSSASLPDTVRSATSHSFGR